MELKAGTDVASGTVLPKIPSEFGGDGSATYSTGTWWNFNEVVRSHGKRFFKYSEFSIAAYGTTEGQSLGGSSVTIPTTTREPGYTSKYGLEQVSGHQWTWGEDSGFRYNNTTYSWKAETEGRGRALYSRYLWISVRAARWGSW